MSYPLGSRATRGITVVITDESGNPVDGAAVSFGLPEMGPTGVFSNGAKSEITTTHADGRASVWGMQWNRLAGSFDVRITATKGQARAGTVCSQKLVEAPGPPVTSLGSSHKWLWIGLAAAGAVGAGVGIAATRGSPAGSCSSTVVLTANPCTAAADPLGITTIGQPTITIGHP